MKIVRIPRLTAFKESHADVRSQIDAWIAEVKEAAWQTPHDIRDRYQNASFIADNRVVFNLKGKKYRLDTKIDYSSQVVLIVRIGTHAEYNSWQF